MDYLAYGGKLSALFETQTAAEIWARKRARDTGNTFTIERGRVVSINGKTGWFEDLTFEPCWIFEEELLKVAPV